MFAHKIIEMMDRLVEMEPMIAAIGKANQRKMQDILMRSGRSNLTNNFDQEEYAQAARVVKQHLEHGQRFYADTLPPNVTPEEFDPEELRLPFPVTSLLFHDPYEKVQTCYCCKEIDPDSISTDKDDDESEGFFPYFVMTVVYREPSGLYEIGNMLYLFGIRNGDTCLKVREQKFADGYLGRPENIVQIANEAAREFCGLLLGFLQMLHCNNVVTESEPAPHRLNKSRKKKGRVPLFEYKVLKIRQTDGTTTSMYGKGTGTSPRLHHRRGYFGNRWMGHGEDKKLVRTWVSPCMVGREDKGVIKKDYQV